MFKETGINCKIEEIEKKNCGKDLDTVGTEQRIVTRDLRKDGVGIKRAGLR